MDKKNILVTTLFYKGHEGAVSADFIIDNETLWATQKTISEVFKVDRTVITKHLKNIYSENELDENSTSAKIAHVQNENGRKVNRDLKFYNLDVLIAIGYRVGTKEGTLFRKWANDILKEYIVKGYVLDDELLKNGTRFGKDYFDGLLERIKEIRSSERRFYQKIADIYATSYDYNKDAKITKEFFQAVQNKLHYAVSGYTAPEIISKRIGSEKSHMGLTTWSGAPDGKIMPNDVKIAKNYLNEKELSKLNRVVSMYLDYAENQAIEQRVMYMKDWAERLDKFLEFNNYEVLKNKGKISRKSVDKIIEEEYSKFRKKQDKTYKSDFDRFLEESNKLLKR
ncbi:MAG: virulence RhuM family protein [Methanobrevibacter sp.]|nr:virulence RhuM family protein [Candidatus Methanovirga meridionalis]